MQDTKPNMLVEFSLLALLALLWGSSYLFSKVAVAEITPITLVAARVSIAAIVLACFMWARNATLPRDLATWRLLFVQAFCNSIGAWTILAWGQQHIDSGLASVLNSTAPLFVFFITLTVTRHEETSALKLFGALLGVVGVVLIVGVDVLRGLGQQVLGQLAALVGAFLYAIAAINGKRFGHLPAVTTATACMLWACACLVPASFVLERPLALSPSPTAIAATLMLGVFSTGLALLIYFRLIRTIGSLGVASQGYLRAGVGVLLGMVILGEQITAIAAFGLIAAIVGVAAINFRLPAQWSNPKRRQAT